MYKNKEATKHVITTNDTMKKRWLERMVQNPKLRTARITTIENCHQKYCPNALRSNALLSPR